MTLRFVIGRAGAGKTTYCLEEIQKELQDRPLGPSIIILVPEQSTFQMEQKLTGLPGLEGSFRAQVYSFRRLAWRVLQETGGANRPFLGDNGKRMVLCRLLEENRHRLKAFARVAKQPGFYDRLAQAIGELKAYHVKPEDLQQVLASWQGESLAKDKLADLLVIYRGFQQVLEGRLIDPDDYLDFCARKIGESQTCQGSEVWVDGFKGFTPQEYEVLVSLLKTSSRVNFLLCLDPGALTKTVKREEVFFCTYNTYTRLLQIANRAGVEVEPALILGENGLPRFRENEALAHLEREFPAWPGRVFSGKVQGLKLVAAEDRRAEVEAVAREILALCREREYRFRDIAVLVRDLSIYGELVPQVFQVYGLPCFVDSRRPVTSYPLIELVRSALEVVLSGWSYEAVFRFLKTDLVPVSREEVDELENYVLAHGIKGSRWADGKLWAYRRRYSLGEEDPEETADLARVNRIREKAVAALAWFEEQVKNSPTAGSVTRALYLLLEQLGVRKELEAWSRAAEAEGRLEEAAEHAEVYNQFLGLLDEMVDALEDYPLSLEEYLRVLDAGLGGLTLGLIPPGLDQVFVGSLERSRPSEVKAAFILGVNDGVLPQPPRRDGLLSEKERAELAIFGVELAPGRQERLFEEQFLVYTGLTRASEYLWVSYPRADEEGRAMNASPVIDRLREVFPSIEVATVSLEPPGGAGDLAYVAVPGRALSFLAARLREAGSLGALDPVWAGAYKWLKKNHTQALHRVLEGFFYRNEEQPLGGDLAQRLYGYPLHLSVSQLEQFASCPFAYFIRYGLRAKEKETAKIRPADLGTFFHDALKRFVEEVKIRRLAWETVGRDECRELADEIVSEMVTAMESEMQTLSERRRYLVSKLKEIVEVSAWAVAEHLACGDFRPVGLELEIGRNGIPPLVVDDGDVKLKLVGKVDRVDAAPNGEGVYLRVIDYKSGSTGFKLDEVYYGLRLQLIAYLDAVVENAAVLWGKEAVPAGVFYFEVKNPLIQGNVDGPEKAELEVLKSFRLKGLVLAEGEAVELMHRGLAGNSHVIPVGVKKDGSFTARSKVVLREQFEWLRRHFRDVAKRRGQRILAGEIAVSPFAKGNRTACDYCGLKAVCRFDVACGDSYRVWDSLEEAMVWQNLKRNQGGKIDGE